MTEQRFWRGWMLWSGIALCLGLGGLLVAHHYAPLYAPSLVLAWSPSTDHITRALFVHAAANPAGVDQEWLRDASRRCSDEALARLFRSGPSGAERSGMILGARIDQPGAEGASARAIVSRLLAEEPAERAAWLIQKLPQGHPVTIALVTNLIDHPHLFVALAAIQSLSGYRSGQALPPKVIEVLRRALAGRARDPTRKLLTTDTPTRTYDPELYTLQITGYRPMFPTRAMTVAEVEEWEVHLRHAAWRALGKCHPDIACTEARSRWEALSKADRENIIRSLSGSDERAIGLLTEIAAGTDDALARFAIQALANPCIAGPEQGSADPGIAKAFVALVDLVFREPKRRVWVDLIRFRGSDPPVLARIAAQLPSGQRALALDLLDPTQSTALRACFDPPPPP